MNKPNVFPCSLLPAPCPLLCSRRAAAEEGYSDRISISDRPARDSTRVEAIRQALRELGYIEDRTSPSSTDMRRGSVIGILSLPPSW